MCLHCHYVSWLSLSSKWKCGNVEICLHCLNLSSNSGSVENDVEMWKYVFIVLIYLVTLEVWKCGNVEICLHCLYLVTLEVWKCGNMSSLSLSSNAGSVEVWKCGNVEICLHCLYLVTLEVWKYVFNVSI